MRHQGVELYGPLTHRRPILSAMRGSISGIFCQGIKQCGGELLQAPRFGKTTSKP